MLKAAFGRPFLVSTFATRRFSDYRFMEITLLTHAFQWILVKSKFIYY